ncbi:KTSC domain-containing protein [Clostridium perfringens]|uniref:KTSC domain-containing protein n=1 Tax=Clostridium perfringens TaxID=1502 RepID=UPI00224601A4|nr:KTSC domain-containing protein [Clostridium perfringens]MCX0399576.1 KTSC domain-containing protein [Clostridium perfringens]
MNMIPVSSSNLVAVGYDSSTATLRVAFHSGVYDYYNVPQNIFEGLLNASSKGKYHHAFIKNSYRYSQVH